MKALFGTDGIRGEAGRFPLDASTVSIIGSSLARYLGRVTQAPSIIIGRDTRESGKWLEQALVSGAQSAGAECHSAGIITTPGVAFLTRRLNADAGVVISASHNPYNDNGIKIFSPSGRKLEDSVERLIESDVLEQTGKIQVAALPESSISRLGDEEFLQQRYLSFLIEEIGQGLSLQGLKIVLDCANGASSRLAPIVFRELGASVVAINCTPDGRNINLNCGSLHIADLQQAVTNEKADFGIAFDGDADRSLFVDNQGTFVDGDATLWILARDMQAAGRLNQDIVVATVMSNIGLEIAFRSIGIRLVRTDVGDKYVLEELLRIGASLGGEQSGHIIIPELSLAGDGVITGILVARALRDSGKTLAELTNGFKQYPQVLLNVRVREKIKFSDLPGVQEKVKEVEGRLAEKGRLLLRYSGTEPLARVMIEGETQSEIDDFASSIAAVIQRDIGV